MNPSHPLEPWEAGDLVRLDGIAQRLEQCWALRGIDLRVAPGELVAVTGHNGSGKTTLLRVVSTALQPTRGEGTVLGHSLRLEPSAVRRHTTFVAHSGGMYADLTAAENLAFMLRMVGDRADRRIADALAWAGLSRAASTRVRELSSGMRRRLALAAARLRCTPLLLMDEPYNSLDATGAPLIDELIAGTAVRGGGALVVMHDLSRSGVAFHRVIELREGRVLSDARPDRRPSLVLAASGD